MRDDRGVQAKACQAEFAPVDQRFREFPGRSGEHEPAVPLRGRDATVELVLTLHGSLAVGVEEDDEVREYMRSRRFGSVRAQRPLITTAEQHDVGAAIGNRSGFEVVAEHRDDRLSLRWARRDRGPFDLEVRALEVDRMDPVPIDEAVRRRVTDLRAVLPAVP